MVYDAYSYIIGSDTGSWNFICPINGCGSLLRKFNA